MPIRYIARSRDALLDELHVAGLEVVEYETYPPLEPLNPGEFRARCVARK